MTNLQREDEILDSTNESESPAEAIAVTSPEPDLLVRRSDEHITHFDRQRIIDALIRETGMSVELAGQISLEIQAMVRKSGVSRLSSSLIRSLVDAKLIEHGLEKEFRAHSRLGVPLYDVDRVIHQARRETSVYALGPEGTSLLLAEAIKREYAILSVFSDPVAKAHLVGDIYIQDLGAVDRPYSITQSLDTIKRYGFTTPHRFANWRPAKHPEVLVAHLVKFSAALQSYTSGPVEWDAVNYCLAPYVEALDPKEIQQLAQSLIFELSSPSLARGGQMLTCTLHLDWDVPAYLKDRIAIGPGGEPTGKPYRDYTEPARTLLRAIFEAYLEGDGQQVPFTGARPVLHITHHFSESPGYKGLLDLVSQVATGRGGVHFVFDRDESTSFYRRYGLPLEGSLAKAESTEWCTAVFQAVSLNLPRAAYRAGATNHLAIFEELTRLMDVAAQAHLEKRIFIEKLMALGEQGPLALLAMRRHGSPFLRLSRTIHWICPIGLNELVAAVTGHQLHESAEARDFGSKVINHLAGEAARLTSRHKTRFVLAESAAEGPPFRLAKTDLQFFSEESAGVLQGNRQTGEVYYTNGIKLSSAARVSALERVRVEGELQGQHLFNAGSDIRMGKEPASAGSVSVFISRAFYQSQTIGLLFSPEFTICLSCKAVTHGLSQSCEACGSTQVDGIAQAADRYSRTSGWSRSMLTELAARNRESLTD
ncbi:MAG: anaerobic ribonucleoside-triphosphate reductase [Blastocatellia bacterium]|nr:anaerobic ribonucleoside-triphosphate reductase [Blastocatellia bacterium]